MNRLNKRKLSAAKVRQPDPAAIHGKLTAAVVLHQQGQLEAAEKVYQEILKTQPNHFEALQLNATIAAQRNQSELAIRLFDHVLRIDPNHAISLNNRACALLKLKRLSEALDGFSRAIDVNPHYAEANFGKGEVLRELYRYAAALASFQRAIAIKANYVDALNSAGSVLCLLHRHAEALDYFDRALAIKPDYAVPYVNRGNALRALNRNTEALESYRLALAIQPDHEYLFGAWLHTRMMICDWSDIELESAKLLTKIAAGKPASVPFPLVAITDSPAVLRSAAEIWVTTRRTNAAAIPTVARYAHDKIRIGYFSADFHDHATANLMAELFERHDKRRFECTAFSFGPDKRDTMRTRLVAAFDDFLDVRQLTDTEIAKLARAREIDIAIDLKGFTQDGREGIFVNRAAPIQVNYLGYPGTMGADYIDYLIADSTIIRETDHRYYSEKLVYLPYSYQVNDRKRLVAERRFTRAELGLPNEGFVFCCFNNSYKITPPVFDRWMQILRQVEGSVLWLLEASAEAVVNLRQEAARRQVDPARLIFAKRMAQAEHLARQKQADLFLDTLPYNAHTTASDALWVGLPVLTCPGNSFASRVAASLLTAIALPELITATAEAYVVAAVSLATNPEKLNEIRRKLAQNRLTTALFDTQLFTRHIEAAYQAMVSRHSSGLAPEHIYVKA